MVTSVDDLPTFEAVQEIEEHVMHLDMAGKLSKALFMKLYDAAEEAVSDFEPSRQIAVLENIVKFADPSWFGFDFTVPADTPAPFAEQGRE